MRENPDPRFETFSFDEIYDRVHLDAARKLARHPRLRARVEPSDIAHTSFVTLLLKWDPERSSALGFCCHYNTHHIDALLRLRLDRDVDGKSTQTFDGSVQDVALDFPQSILTPEEILANIDSEKSILRFFNKHDPIVARIAEFILRGGADASCREMANALGIATHQVRYRVDVMERLLECYVQETGQMSTAVGRVLRQLKGEQ